MITIDKAEALARLSDKPVIEVQFECRPNTGVTHVYDVQREGAVEIINNKAATVYESGIHAQERNMGLHVGFVHKEHGPGLLFLETKPECRLSKDQLADSIRNGHASKIFSARTVTP